MINNDDQYLVEEPLLLKEYKADGYPKTKTFRSSDIPKTRVFELNKTPRTIDNVPAVLAKNSEYEFEMQVDKSSNLFTRILKKIFVDNFALKALAIGVAGVLWIIIAGMGAGG